MLDFDRQVLLSIALAILLVLGSFFSATLGILIGSAYVVWLMWRCDAKFLPAILIISLRPSDFQLQDYGSMDYTIREVASSYVFIAGFPLTINLVMGCMIPLRVCFELFHDPDNFRSRIGNGIFIMWLLAMIPSLIMSYLGWREGNNGWTDPVRSSFIVGSYFYGLIMARTWPRKGNFFLKYFMPIMLGLFVIKFSLGFHHRLLWIFAAMMPALSVHLWEFRNPHIKVLSLVNLVTATLFCFGLLGNSMTFTLVGLYTASLVMGIVSFSNFGSLSEFLKWLWGWPAIITILVFMAFVNFKFDDYYNPGAQSETVFEKFRAKVFDDRANLWISSYRSIAQGHPIIEPAGRPWIFHHQKQGEIYVTFGSHNTIIDQLRKNRYFSGVIILWIMFFAVYKASIVLRKSPVPELKVLAITAIATGTVGVVTGHYPLGQNAGFWFLVFAGIAVGVFQNVKFYEKMIMSNFRRGLVPGQVARKSVARTLSSHTPR